MGAGQRVRTIPPLRRDENGTAICRHWDCEKPVGKGRRSWCSAECVHDALMQANPGYARDQVFARDHGICAECGTDTREIRTTKARLRGWTGYKRTIERICKRLGFANETALRRAENWGHWDRQREAVERSRAISPHPERYRTPCEPEPPGCDKAKARQTDRFMAILTRQARIRQKLYNAELRQQGYDPSRSSHWDMDHIIEVIRGGSNQMDNLQTLCQPCHKRKTARLARERAEERSGQPSLLLKEKP